MINYRYTVLKKLGEGGSGEVFLAEDALNNQRVAMKFLSVSGDHHVDDTLIRREFALLSGLSHPNLIRVFEFDSVLHSDEPQFLGRYFYTMEYLQGRDALEHVRTLPDGKERTELLQKILVQTLGVLDHIHREGIIHFDVKPQNLFLVPGEGNDRTVKLTDFGFSESRVESVDVPIRGTMEYTAPEMLKGHAVDHRVDLYSLGVTLYHLWQGHCPFEAPTSVELVKRVLSEEFPKIRVIDNASIQLQGIIEKLCRRNPEDRFRDAREAMLMFASSKFEDLAKESLHLGQQLRYTGREQERRQVHDVLDAFQQGDTDTIRTVLIVGAQGIGKSAFLNEVTKDARARGVLTLRSEVNGSPEPLASFQHALGQLKLELRARGISFPESAVTPGDEHFAGKLDAREKQSAWCVSLLHKASQSLPFLLVVDDLHELDRESIDTISRLASRSAESRMLVVAGVKDTEIEEVHLQNEKIIKIPLSELPFENFQEMINASLGSGFAQTGLARRIYDLYGGIPYVIMEAIRSIASALPLALLNNPIMIGEIASEVEEFLSLKFEEFFALRFHMLRREKQLLLELLSCFETSPSLDILGTIAPFQKARMEQYIRSLQNAGYVIVSSENPRFQIRHLKLKQHVYKGIIEDRLDLHSFIVKMMESIPRFDEWIDMKEFGRQYELSGNNEQASDVYERAAEMASRQNALSDALDLLKKALVCLPKQDHEEKEISLLMKTSQAYFSLGMDRESIDTGEKLLHRLPPDNPRRVEIHAALGKAFSRLGENLQALSQFEEALRCAKADMHRLEIRQEIIALKIAEGNFDEAIHMSGIQKELATQQQDRQLLALVETDLGIAQFYKGNLQASLESFHTASTIYTTARNRNKTIDALNNIGNVLSAMRDYRGALEKWKQALTLASELGVDHQRALILNNIGIAHYRLGEYEEARRQYENARDIFSQLNSKNGLAMTFTNLGEVAYAEGVYETSLKCWNEALGIYTEMQDTAGIVQTLLQSTHLHISMGDAEAGREALRRAKELIQQYDLSTFRASSAYLEGMLGLKLGKYEEAINEFEAAEKEFSTEGSFTGESGSPEEQILLTRLRKALALSALNTTDRAVAILRDLQSDEKTATIPLLSAEIYYELGMISKKNPDHAREKALVYFRNARSLIEREQVSEISWKIAYALGKEYLERGNKERARENFIHAGIVIEYFAAQFSSENLRDRYLSAENRSTIISEIAALTRSMEI